MWKTAASQILSDFFLSEIDQNDTIVIRLFDPKSIFIAIIIKGVFSDF